MELIKEVLNSWRRCIKKGVANSGMPRKICREELQIRKERNINLLSVCDNSAKEIIKSLTGSSALLVTDTEGVVIRTWMKGEAMDMFPAISEGMLLDEKNCGTNPIAMACRLKKKISMPCEYNYCDFFKNIYSYAVPIILCHKFCGLLSIMSWRNPLEQYQKTILELLVFKVAKEMEMLPCPNVYTEHINIGDIQKKILVLLAEGFTDKLISREIQRSINTVHYHKKIIFSRLNANNSTEAVIKAILNDIISLNDIRLNLQK